MSMEMYVLSDTKLSSMSEWQAAIDADSFPLRLALDGAFGDLQGFLPAVLSGKQTGFECYHLGLRDVVDGDSSIQFGHEWKNVLAFVWGGDHLELLAASMASASYARAVSGILFDGESGELLGAAEAIEQAQDLARRYLRN